jgi:acetyl esterase/lipase
MNSTRHLLPLIAAVLASANFVSAQVPTVTERFDRLDQNRDGKLSPQELPRRSVFRRLDRNADGVIERHELQPATSTKPAAEDQPQITSKIDISYGDHDLQRLDLYQPQDAGNAPIMVYVHGGGWKRGDKRSVGQKADFFCRRGWVFVSVNYRLLPEGKHPANVNDIAKAIVWAHQHAAEHGGDPDRIFIMGHSAGCHLVALVATNQKYLEQAGESLDIVKGVIALDTQAFNLPKLIAETPSALYAQMFSKDPQVHRDASPLHHVAKDKGIPPFLICYSSGMGRRPNPKRPSFTPASSNQDSKHFVR